MIRLTKFDGTPFVLNAEWIQTVEETPDTLITLTTGFQLLVRDKAEAVIEAFKEYKRDSAAPALTGRKKASGGRS